MTAMVFRKLRAKGWELVEFKVVLPVLSLLGFPGWACGLFDLIVRRRFVREQAAVLRGRWEFRRCCRTGNVALLRRAIHRLEKGLAAKDRKRYFALEYIENAVRAFSQLAGGPVEGVSCASTLMWARGVLTKYFELCEGAVEIERARAVFLRTRGDATAKETDDNPIDVPDALARLLVLLRTRRSVRDFRQESVPRSSLLAAVGAATLAPSACNRMPYRFVICDAEPRCAQLLSLAPGATGFPRIPPAVAAIVGRLDYFDDERDRHLIYIDGSLAGMAFMLALESMGISSCPINWPDIPRIDSMARQALRLAESERPVMLVAIGYRSPECELPASARKAPREVCDFV